LNRRAGDVELWTRIEERASKGRAMREFIVIVSELAAKLFVAPLPKLVRTWSAKIRPATRLWIKRYSRNWAFCDLPVYRTNLFPTALLARLLRQQYQDGAAFEEAHLRHRNSSTWPARVVSSLRSNPSLLLNAAWWKRQVPFRRMLFHAMARLRYLCEIPRWRWLNRASLRSPSDRTQEQRGPRLKPGDFAEF
jgi:hypothetical protein